MSKLDDYLDFTIDVELETEQELKARGFDPANLFVDRPIFAPVTAEIRNLLSDDRDGHVVCVGFWSRSSDVRLHAEAQAHFLNYLNLRDRRRFTLKEPFCENGGQEILLYGLWDRRGSEQAREWLFAGFCHHLARTSTLCSGELHRLARNMGVDELPWHHGHRRVIPSIYGSEYGDRGGLGLRESLYRSFNEHDAKAVGKALGRYIAKVLSEYMLVSVRLSPEPDPRLMAAAAAVAGMSSLSKIERDEWLVQHQDDITLEVLQSRHRR